MPTMSQPPEDEKGEKENKEAARTEADAQREEQTEAQASPAQGDLGDLPE